MALQAAAKNIERARELRAAGWRLKEIASAVGQCESWVSKETKGIFPGQRSRIDALNRPDLPQIIKDWSERGYTAPQIAERLGISTGHAWYLRSKHFGLTPGRLADREAIAEALVGGEKSRSIADRLNVSVSFVDSVRREAGISPSKEPCRAPRSRRSIFGLLDYAKRNFVYTPETGQITSRGKAVGSIKGGYLAIAVRSRTVMAHRLAWLLHYEEEPPEVIDHRDGDPLNNRIDNLRSASVSQNAFNKKKASNNTTGIKGVSVAHGGRYRVRVQAGHIALRSEASSLSEARETRQRLAELLHGEFARHA